MWRERCGSSGKRCGSGWCGSGGCAGLACSPSRPSARCSACAWAGVGWMSRTWIIKPLESDDALRERFARDQRAARRLSRNEILRRNPRGASPCLVSFVAWICRLRTGLGGTRARGAPATAPRDRTGAGRPCHTSPHPYNAVHGESIPMTVTAAPLQYVGPKHTKQKPRAWRAARRARTCLLTAHSHRRSQTLARAVEVPPLSVNADTEAKWHERQST